MILKYVFAWFGLVLVAIVNGGIRNFAYQDILGEQLAHQVSTFTGIVFIGLYVLAISRRWRLQSSGQALAVGLIWLGLTIAFEFLFGHYVMGHPWSRLFHDYNILEGRVWILVLLWTTIAPYIFYRFVSSTRGKQPPAKSTSLQT